MHGRPAYQRHAKGLNHFHLSCLKAVKGQVRTVFKLVHLIWSGNVIRILDERLPNKVFYGELQEGKRSQGGQMKHYKDTLKASLNDFDIGSLEQTAQGRSKWRGRAAHHEEDSI